jgi:hypothetical protein
VRQCVFLVADKSMSEMLKGLFSRDQFHLSLGCGAFSFDPDQDIWVANGLNDPGLYAKGNELLRGFAQTHQHAVIVADAAWEGSPGKEAMEQRLQEHLEDAGWINGAGCAVVIDPELEMWVWQDSPHVCDALGYNGTYGELRMALIQKELWHPTEVKPYKPKEAAEWTLRESRKPKSSAIYNQVARTVSIHRCTDAGFNALRTALTTWFVS